MAAESPEHIRHARPITPAVTWLRRRGLFASGVATLALALIANATALAVATPQVSGARAELATSTLLAALAGASAVVALRTADPIAEARATRRLRGLRALTIILLLSLGAMTFTFVRHGPDLTALRVYLFFAACSLLVGRFMGMSVAAVFLAGYTGLCLFAGVPTEERPAWWAVLMQPVDSFRPVASTAVSTMVVAVLASWEPPLPSGYRRRSMAIDRER